ncbi:hypothetical protein HAX54_017611, partial [Datura stramonium]|nr:hypothetical protein [Datura stramonium]
VCDEHSEFLAKKALDDGAYLYLKKPLDEQIVKYLWQFVLGEKIQRERARKESEENKNQMNVDDIGNNDIAGDNEEQTGEKINVPSNTEAENDIISKGEYKPGRKRGRKITKEINEGESQSNTINKIVMRKNCLKWTGYLHAKFMKVVQQLGEGRCYPKEIVEAMNVPGLTREQVASHLQNLEPPSADLPNEHGNSDFNQIFSDNQ